MIILVLVEKRALPMSVEICGWICVGVCDQCEYCYGTFFFLYHVRDFAKKRKKRCMEVTGFMETIELLQRKGLAFNFKAPYM